MEPKSLDLQDAYCSIKVTSVFTNPSVHETVKTLLTHCEWFATVYMQGKLSANLWKFSDTELHIYYQLEQSITQEEYYLNAVYTSFHNLSFKIYEDVKQLLAQIYITNVPKCKQCLVRHDQ